MNGFESLLGENPSWPGAGARLDRPAFASRHADIPCRCTAHADEPCPGRAEVPVPMPVAGQTRRRLELFCCRTCYKTCGSEQLQEEIARDQHEAERAAVHLALRRRLERATEDLRGRIPPEFRDARSTHECVADRVAKLRAVRVEEAAYEGALRTWQADRQADRQLPRPPAPTLRPQGLLALGSVGRGKTHLAYSLLNVFVEEGLVEPSRCFVGTEDNLFAAPARGRFAEYEQSLMPTLAKGNFDVVLVDDIGRGTWAGGDDARQRVLGNVFEYAMSHRKIVIVTANYAVTKTDNPLERALGEAAYSRLIRTCCDDAGAGTVLFDDRMPDRRNPSMSAPRRAAR